jgi:glycerol-3-phosphate dehydrogenase
MAKTRARMWEKLGGSYDLLVVGAGIVGAGIARDAARRGLSVAVVDMGDIAGGTSSRSSKLIHGGLRYLEQREFSLVFESVSERRVLMDLAPHLVNPLGFLFPVYRGAKHKLWFINAGMWVYDGLSLFRSPKIHKKLSAAEIAEIEPGLEQTDLKGAPLYYDCSTDDARLTLETALDATDQGAVVATYARVVRFAKDDHGRVRGAVVRDELGGQEKEVRALAVINATGPWTDLTLALDRKALDAKGAEPAHELLRPTKGVHIVVAREKLPLTHAVVCVHPKDKRTLFAIPWGESTYVGTTDTDYEGDPGDVAATSEDVDYLIEAVAGFFPRHPIRRDDVISTWAGIRPLIAPARDNVDESAVSREHEIIVSEDGLITIAGGKLTTYRRMSREVVDTVVPLLEMSGLDRELRSPRTDKVPLPGGLGWPDDDDHDKVAAQVRDASERRLDLATARHLADCYGMRGVALARMCRERPELAAPLIDGRPEIRAQIDWAVNEELASTLGDVLIRRMQLFYRAADQGLEAVEAVADRMAALLDWNAAQRARRVESYRAEVARSRAWKT